MRPARGIGVRLLVAQVLVLLASIVTAGVVALLVGPPLFHAHLVEAGHAPNAPELQHIERAFRDASVVSLGVALALALAFALVVTWWVTRRIRAPLAALAGAAREVSRGHLAARVPVSGAGYEFDSLGGAFNLMAERLEQTEETRRRLLSDLAHELRTPIATLTVYCEGLRDGVTVWDDATARVISEQTERLARLAGDIDIVSRAEEGRLALSLSDERVADLVATALAAAGPRAGEVALGSSLGDAAAARVRVDRDRIGQVLDNLLGNALRHTAARGSVTVRAQVVGDEVEISVVDTGEGIDPQSLPHVFERFYRGDSARARDRAGSGIGLTISRAIVDAHGGALTAASEGRGTGSTFTISLPLAAAG
jgi:signal transduction histidine kinase